MQWFKIGESGVTHSPEFLEEEIFPVVGHLGHMYTNNYSSFT